MAGPVALVLPALTAPGSAALIFLLPPTLHVEVPLPARAAVSAASCVTPSELPTPNSLTPKGAPALGIYS